jgi:hypothetical protein
MAELCSVSAAPLKWSCNWPEAKSQTFSLYHGETAQLQPSFYVNGVLATNLTIEAAYYQTNGMADAWWELPGATFAPSNDCGAASYRFFVRAADAAGVNYRANGVLRMLDSPGFSPSEVALPIRRLDFSTVELVNAPYYTKSETDAKIVELSPPADLSNATNYTDSVASSLRESIAVAASSATNYTDSVAATLAPRHVTDDCWLKSDVDHYYYRQGDNYWVYDSFYPEKLYYLGDNQWMHYQSTGVLIRPVTRYYSYAEAPADAASLTLTNGFGVVINLVRQPGTTTNDVVYTDILHSTVTNLEAQIAAAQPADYATVSNKAMTALQSYTETDPTIYSWAKASSKPTYSLNDVAPSTENWLGVPGTTAGGKSIKVLAKTVNGVIEGGMTVTGSSNNDNNTTKYRYGGVTVTRSGTATDYLFDATANNGIVRRSELAPISSDIATISALLNAENARFVSTHYNSVAHLPEAYVEAKIDGSWLTIWSEMTRWNWLTDTYLPANFYTKGQINSALDDKADRAWGFYDSHSGLYAPEGYTWVSSPKIAIAGGLAYSRTLTSEGAVWVLEANGMVAETGGLTNGVFRITDDESNALFEIVRGDKRTVGATANSVQVIAGFTPTKLQIGYNVVADDHPTLQITTNLVDAVWYAGDDANCPANVTWSGVSGAYVATVQAKSASATLLFAKAEYEIGGETYIKNTAPISVSGGIYCTDGIHRVRPVYNNGNITWEVVQ